MADRGKGSRLSRLLVHVEGQTEESFVNKVLAPHLQSVGYTAVSARLLGNARQRSHRGGIRQWNSVRNDILNHLTEDQTTLATTMVDYYGLPNSWPGQEGAGRQNTLTDRAALVESRLLEDISRSLGSNFNPRRFVPYVVMHEFEGLLFSDPERFAQGIGRQDLASEFQAIRDEFRSPEEINDSPDTALSKRVVNLYRGYQKPSMGIQAIEEIGLDAIRRECPLFNGWVGELEERAGL